MTREPYARRGAGRAFVLALAALCGGFFLAAVLAAVWFVASAPAAIFLLFAMAVLYGWMLYAYLRYRHGRQDEVLALLSAAVDTNAPLAPALWAYVHDRPGGLLHEFWVALLQFFVFPGYYWIWHRRHRFDRAVAELAELLEQGVPLSDAVREVPAVLSREARLAVEVGEATGRVRDCLRRARRERLSAAWLEVAPRVVYPLVVVWLVLGIFSFLMTMILPKYKRIFDEFGFKLPEVTRWLGEAWEYFPVVAVPLALIVPGGLVLVALLAVSPGLRWHLPLVGGLFRWDMQGQVLRLLAALTEVGKPAPQALELLADAGGFPAVARRRLEAAHKEVRRGEPLADALYAAGLLPGGMVPLVASAERARTLPWTLYELGDYLGGRALRIVRRTSLIVAPLLVAAVGALVAFVALGMFMPLIHILRELSEQ